MIQSPCRPHHISYISSLLSERLKFRRKNMRTLPVSRAFIIVLVMGVHTASAQIPKIKIPKVKPQPTPTSRQCVDGSSPFDRTRTHHLSERVCLQPLHDQPRRYFTARACIR